jgi:hypothetical protein
MSIALKGAILAASRRADGAVVFLDVEGDWNENMRTAAVARASDERRALADRATYEARRHLVVAPQLIEVVEVDGRVVPARPGGQRRSASDTLADMPLQACANGATAHLVRGEAPGRAADASFPLCAAPPGAAPLCAATERPGVPRGSVETPPRRI